MITKRRAMVLISVCCIGLGTLWMIIDTEARLYVWGKFTGEQFYCGKSRMFWRNRILDGKYRFGGWTGSISFYNDPPFYLRGPHWTINCLEACGVRNEWAQETYFSATDPRYQGAHNELELLFMRLIIDDNGRVRSVAAQALGTYGSQEDETKKALLIALDDPDETVRESAKRSLRRMHFK